MKNAEPKLPRFLADVDRITADMNKEKLQIFLHEIARTWPMEDRTRFLEMLTVCENGKTAPSDEEDNSLIQKDIRKALKLLSDISKGKKCLSSECNEQWDDWRDDEDDEFVFTDPHGVTGDIKKAMDCVYACIDRNLYKDGLPLVESLSTLEIEVGGDYAEFDGECFSVGDLADYDLLQPGFHDFVTSCLYLVYMASEPEKRPEEVFRTRMNFDENVSLEELMQSGDTELPEFDRFLPRWISLLGRQKGKEAENLLTEAMSMLTDEAEVLSNAGKYASEHPVLYLNLLRDRLSGTDDGESLKIGEEALSKTDAGSAERAEIAMITAEFAQRLGEKKKADSCRLEAFRSEPSPLGFLRVLLQNDDPDDVLKAREIYESRHQTGHTVWFSEKDRDYCTMLFYDGRFQELWETELNKKEGVGWSMSFMKDGIAAMLLLLYQGKGPLPQGLKGMRSRFMDCTGFRKKEFFRAAKEFPAKKTDENQAFEEMFEMWKIQQHISAEKAEEWLHRIGALLQLRVEGIMNGNHRKYYWECAEFLAAYGETLESAGEAHAKIKVLESYRAAYPRRTAFRSELKSFGLPDAR